MRAAVLLLAALLMAGCGFEPLYGPRQGKAAVDLAAVEVAPIGERLGQRMRNALVDGIGARPDAPKRWRLDVQVAEQRQDLGLQRGAGLAYARVTFTASYSLTDLRTGAVVLANSARAANSFNVVETGFGTLQAQEDARSRGVEQLSDDILARVALYLRNFAG